MAGAGYKLFNTGDVLTAAQVNTYLQEQVVMVFNDATARTTALSGVLAEGMVSYLKSTKVVEIYNGTAWASLDDPNAIQNTIVDAKGDLITATANDTPARLAVGNNGETLVADSSTSTGLRWQGNFAAGKNAVINGDFRIWQRGTSFVSPASATFTSDRWQYLKDGTGTCTVSQQTFTPGTAPVAGYEGAFFLRNAGTALGNSVNFDIQQKIEDVRTFAGQTVTVSFWAKADSARTLTLFVGQDYGSGGSATTYPLGGQTYTLSTSWTRYSTTFTMSSISGKTIGTSSFVFLLFRNAASASLVFDLWGVQLEIGNTATAFQTATGTLAGELAACQRYYYRTSGNGGYRRFGAGQCYGTGNVVAYISFPVTMRTNPTALEQSGTASHYAVTNSTAGPVACNTVPSFDNANNNGSTVLFTTASGLTAGNATTVMDNNTSSAYLGWSAEL